MNKKERAEKALAKWDDRYFYHYSELTEDAFIDGYIEGATEQRRIDIDKACDWLRARNVLTAASLKGFRKAMEDEND